MPALASDAAGAFPRPAPAPAPGAAPDEIPSLRERLTEREDQRRPAEPWSTEVDGRPLVLSGEFELDLDALRRRVVGGAAGLERDRALLEQGLELEAFYSFGTPLSLFAQLRVTFEHDALPDTFEGVSDLYVERGEMWLHTERIAGSGFAFDVGRLDFEDERRWWWDDELDAARLEYDGDTWDVTLAVARELLPSRSDRSFVDPERDRLVRWIGEAGWEWRPEHALELFLLHQRDHSPAGRPGDVLHSEREDESDARLTWVGARLMGAAELGSRHIVGYWLDTAYVRGRERFVDYDTLSRRRSRVDQIVRRDVRGWALDLGATWILPRRGDPRLFAGFATTSRDATPDAGSDRGFRQSDLAANEAGFGGVQRFAHYGLALDPELSNLQVWTAGAGLVLLRSSSLDLVYHHYRLREPATQLRDARVEADLTGRSRDLGYGVDLVLALEEWEHLELELRVAGFRAGRAFGPGRGDWSYGAAFAVRYAF